MASAGLTAFALRASASPPEPWRRRKTRRYAEEPTVRRVRWLDRMPNTFISYRRDDAAGYAGRLHEALEDRLGRDQIFRDVDTLQPGQDFAEAIESRLNECRVFLALIGREWLDARDSTGQRRIDQSYDYVRLEISRALSRRDVLVIPVLIEGASMPAAEALPEDLRSLARKQAVHLRDDAWDHDVGRLASAISSAKAAARSATPTTTPTSPRRWIVAAVALATIAALVFFVLRREDSDAPGVVTSLTPADSTTVSSSSSRGQPYGIVIPRVAEVAHPSLIYTLLSASVVPLGSGSSELRLRVRFSNEGRYDANAWDASFRLAMGGDTLAPSGGLNELVPGHSLRQWIVSFNITTKPGPAVLQVIEGNRVAEIPLDLSPTSRPAEDERADAGDALSRAIVRNIAGTPRLLVRDSEMSVTVERATIRRFANVLRLRLALRFANTRGYAAAGLDATLRLVAGDEVLAPIEAPNVVIEGNSNASTDVEFEVPSTTTRAVLRGTIRSASGEWPLELQ